jgi:dihydrofolate reductase
MRKIILSMPITLDGYIEGPHRELDWVIADDDLHDFYSDLLEQTDLIMYGRVTYELMVRYWPIARSDPSLPMSMHRYANTINPMKKVVFSTTLKNAEWNTQVIHTLIPKEISKLKVQPGGNIALGGGAAIAQAFIQHGLVDELQLLVQPVAIGEGKPLFNGIRDLLKLDFLWSRSFDSGTVALCYRIDEKT